MKTCPYCKKSYTTAAHLGKGKKLRKPKKSRIKKVKFKKPTFEVGYKCGCTGHHIVFSYHHDKTQLWESLFIGIYQRLSPHTGKKYKKPKLEADVVLDGRQARNLVMMLQREFSKKGG